MPSENPLNLPKILFFKNQHFYNADTRRVIDGVVGEFGGPFELRQIKLIDFSEESVSRKMIVGNHGHFRNSDQWEIIVILGEANQPLFQFRCREYDGQVQEHFLSGGDVVLIPPGCTLALIALAANSRILEISNKEYHAGNYIVDQLF